MSEKTSAAKGGRKFLAPFLVQNHNFSGKKMFFTSQKVIFLAFQNFTDVRFATFSILTDVSFRECENFTGVRFRDIFLGNYVEEGWKKNLTPKCKKNTKMPEKIGPPARK